MNGAEIPTTAITIGGIHSVLFAVFHLMFWKLFDWKKELPKTNVSIRAVIQILNLRLIWVFFGIGFLCFVYPTELATTPMGHAVLIGMSLFWVGRLIEQFIFLPYNNAFVHMLSSLRSRVRS